MNVALWKLLQAEKMSPAGVALWLTWQMGLRLDEIVAPPGTRWIWSGRSFTCRSGRWP